MAQSSLQSSSSPAQRTTNQSTPFASSHRPVEGVQYRRNVFVDGDRIRISETPRRRRGEIVGAQDSSNISSQNSERAVSRTSSGATRQSPIIHQSTSSPVEEMLRTRHDSSIEIASSLDDSWCLPSKQSSEASYQHIHELCSPQTPRIQRMPTPDLEPWRVDLFCDCQPCNLIASLSIREW